MKIVAYAASLAGLVLLSACGGSSSPPAPTISFALSSSSGSASVTEGTTATTQTVTGASATTGNFTTPVVADVSYDKTVYSSVTAVAGATPGSYVLTLTTLPDLGGGDYASPVTARLCQEAACTHVYAGTSVTYNFTLTVKLHDWVTFQRDAGHTGYVHATLDPSKFAKAWEFTNPDGNYNSPVISGNGAAFFGSDFYKVYSLNEATGAVNWAKDIYVSDKFARAGAPAYANGSVYVPTLDFSGTYGAGKILAMDAVTGTIGAKSPFISQASGAYFNSPVVQGGDLFFTDGYFGDTNYRYALPAGTQTWVTANTPGVSSDQQSPAVDDKYVYYYNYFSVSIFNRADGILYAQVGDPVTYTTGASGYMAPVITPAGHVVVGGNQSQAHVLMAIDPATKSVVWRSKAVYTLQPVTAKGVIYVARSYPDVIDAVSDTDGSVLWSWAMPSTDTKLIENPVVCDNLLFVSTDKTVYAIDLTTHQTVWTYAAHGRLSLSAGYILYISAQDYGVAGKITAIKLR